MARHTLENNNMKNWKKSSKNIKNILSYYIDVETNEKKKVQSSKRKRWIIFLILSRVQ